MGDQDVRKTTRDTQLDLVGTELNVRNAEVLRPAEANLGQEDERNNHAETVRGGEGQEGTKDHHDGDGAREGPAPSADPRAEASEQDGAKGQTQVLRQSENNSVAEVGGLVGEEDGNHGRVDDVETVIEHGDDEADDEGGSQLAAVVAGEDTSGRQGLLERGEGLPEGEGDEGAET